MSSKLGVRILKNVVFTLLVIASSVPAASQKCWLCTKPVVNLPVTLEKGTVRSPEFAVKNKLYIIQLQVDNTLPHGQLDCLMGIYLVPHPDNCEMVGFHLAVEAEWTLYAGAQVVAHGIVHGKDNNFEISSAHTSRYFGNFLGNKNKKYVLEITFIRDGAALRVANPRIVVIQSPGLDM